MSLINDALKRAQQAQPRRLPRQETDRPLQPATISQVGRSTRAPVYVALVAVGGLAVGFWMKASWRSTANETGRRAVASQPVARTHVTALVAPVTEAANGSGTKPEMAGVGLRQAIPPSLPTPSAPPQALPSETARAQAPATALERAGKAEPVTREVQPVEGQFSVYIVRSGDTLTRIARRHGTTLNALRAVNTFKTDRIVIGQKIRVPVASSG